MVKRKGNTLTREAEIAVYDLLESGPISRERASRYAHTLEALVAARVARRTSDGGYELARGGGAPRVPRTEPPPSTRYVDLTVDLPADCIAILDALGPTRDAAVIKVLRPMLGSGVWRKR
jgi:hypothetical protein